MQAYLQLSGRKGTIHAEEFFDLSEEDLIAKIRERLANRDPHTLCITAQVAFPDPDFKPGQYVVTYDYMCVDDEVKTKAFLFDDARQAANKAGELGTREDCVGVEIIPCCQD